MFGQDFFNDTIKKYVAIFGTLFNDININRVGTDGKTVNYFKVPIAYGPYEHYLARIEQDANLDRGFSIHLPRMSFELVDYQYDGNRKLPTTMAFMAPITQTDGTVAMEKMYVPVPYNFNFQLTVVSKTLEDGHKIVEQILPFFTPTWSVTAQLITGFDYPLDLYFTLNKVTPNDQYESDFAQRRVITWTLDFTLKGYLFGPIAKAKVIKIATVNYRDLDNGGVMEKVLVQPGLTTTGQPTTNAASSISPLLINESDNWGYVVTFSEFPTA